MNKDNRQLLLLLSLLGILLIAVGATFFIYSQWVNRIVLRIDFHVVVPPGYFPVYGAVHDGNLTIYNVGRVDIHNVFVEYTPPWGGWSSSEEKVFFGDIPSGENKTAFVEDFYLVHDRYVNFPMFHIVMDEGFIYISTDEFYNKDWIVKKW